MLPDSIVVCIVHFTEEHMHMTPGVKWIPTKGEQYMVRELIHTVDGDGLYLVGHSIGYNSQDVEIAIIVKAFRELLPPFDLQAAIHKEEHELA